jgi:acylphosphatase
MGDLTRVRLVVHGRVQGVGFRYAAREAALECGIAGWVRNLPDGTVEIVAQGTAGAVEALRSWAEHGPPHAAVRRVVREIQVAEPALRGFEILRTPRIE